MPLRSLCIWLIKVSVAYSRDGTVQDSKVLRVRTAHISQHPARGVTGLRGARGKKQVWHLMFVPEVFRKQMYCIEESTCDIVVFLRTPQ